MEYPTIAPESKLYSKRGFKPNKNKIPITNAIPSVTHMELVALAEAGHLKYLVSQNTDGLHLRSGFKPSLISELTVTGTSKMQKIAAAIISETSKKYKRDAALTAKEFSKTL